MSQREKMQALGRRLTSSTARKTKRGSVSDLIPCYRMNQRRAKAIMKQKDMRRNIAKAKKAKGLLHEMFKQKQQLFERKCAAEREMRMVYIKRIQVRQVKAAMIGNVKDICTDLGAMVKTLNTECKEHFRGTRLSLVNLLPASIPGGGQRLLDSLGIGDTSSEEEEEEEDDGESVDQDMSQMGRSPEKDDGLEKEKVVELEDKWEADCEDSKESTLAIAAQNDTKAKGKKGEDSSIEEADEDNSIEVDDYEADDDNSIAKAFAEELRKIRAETSAQTDILLPLDVGVVYKMPPGEAAYYEKMIRKICDLESKLTKILRAAEKAAGRIYKENQESKVFWKARFGNCWKKIAREQIAFRKQAKDEEVDTYALIQ